MNNINAFSNIVTGMPPDISPLQAALQLAIAGVSVFPVSERKSPLTKHGFYDASADPGQVSKWWARHPTANLAIPTGAPTGVTVLDVDVRENVNGYESLRRAQDAGLLSGWDFAVRTPSGGTHLYFPLAPNEEQRSWQAPQAGIDFRGDGGYIIIPPSSRSIRGSRIPYSVSRVNNVSALPIDSAALRNFLAPKQQVFRPRSRSSASFNVAHLAAWVARLQEGERNHGLFWAACKMAENHLDAQTAFEALEPSASLTGLSAREIEQTIRSAYRTVTGRSSAKQSPLSSVGNKPPPARFQRQAMS